MGHDTADMQLGPAGAGKADPAAVVSLPEPPAPAPGSPTNPAMDLAKAIIPGIGGIMKGIETVEGAWKMLKGESPTQSMGPSAALPPSTSKINQIQLDRALRYAIAETFIGELMRIGHAVGVDFATWNFGMPPETPAAAAPQKDTHAAPSAPSAPAPATATPATPAAAPAAPAAPAPVVAAAPNFGRAQPLVDFVAGASLEDLKQKTQITLLQKIQRANLNPMPWYWNGSNMHGFGTPPEKGHFTKMDFPKMWDPDADGRTWVQVNYFLSVAKLTEDVMLGMPAATAHFSIVRNNHEPAINIGWYEGGLVSTHKQEAEGDKVEPTLHVNFNEGINPPVGGHHILMEFQWDNSVTQMQGDLTFFPISMIAFPPTPEVSGEPAT
jgi:hypothetical protein